MKHYGISVTPERRSTLPTWDSEYESRLIYSEVADTLYYGSDTGWVTISGGGGGGTSSHAALTELDYASAGHTGFQPAGDYLTETEINTISGALSSEIDSDISTHSSSGDHDGRYYTESEINTISGSLSAEIDSDITTHTSNADAHHTESHNIASHSDTTATGAELNELTGSGDTSLHKHDDRYYTETEVDTVSGTLQTDIDTRAISGGAEHDGFSDFVDNEHIDHSGVTITAGTGLTGGGDITVNRTLDVDVGITNDKIVQMDDLDAASGDYVKLTASGIEGRSVMEVLSDLDTDNRYRDVYKTIYIDAAEMIPATTNGSIQGTKEYGTNDIDVDYLAFDGGATEERALFKIKMPENWDRGTIKAKFDWSTATGSTANDTVEWGIKAGALSDNDAIDAALGTPQVISDVLLANDGADLQTTAKTPALTVGGTPAVNDMLIFEIYRNTDGTDDCVEDAHLFGVTLQIKLSGAVTAW